MTSESTTTEALVVLTTVETAGQGREIARQLVESRLAGCVQILPAMTSIYHWEDRIEEATEVMLLIKTRRPLYDQLEARLRQLHPYQTPEILALPVSAGATGYLAWLRAETSSPSEKPSREQTEIG